MTDNVIIKALECCVSANYICPHTCPMLKNKDCFTSLRKNALDLITRQQAKIEEFMKETAVTTLIDDAVVYTPTLEDYNKFKKKFKSEAAKELAERIKELIQTKEFTDDVAMLMCAFIDNICKEMVGDDNAKM